MAAPIAADTAVERQPHRATREPTSLPSERGGCKRRARRARVTEVATCQAAGRFQEAHGLRERVLRLLSGSVAATPMSRIRPRAWRWPGQRSAARHRTREGGLLRRSSRGAHTAPKTRHKAGRKGTVRLHGGGWPRHRGRPGQYLPSNPPAGRSAHLSGRRQLHQRSGRAREKQ